jgi:hypothetical protein
VVKDFDIELRVYKLIGNRHGKAVCNQVAFRCEQSVVAPGGCFFKVLGGDL